MGTHPIFESDFDCLTDMNNGLHAFIQNVITRIVITLLSAVANLIIPDHNADAFKLRRPYIYVGDYVVGFLLDGHSKWDSAHFLDISLNGYQHEHKFAFFPFYPYAIKFLADGPIFMIFGWFMSDYYRALLSGWILSIIYSSVAATVLYRTMVRLTTSQIAAHCCTVIFMINPAGIFFNSCYTESAYFCFFITGFYFLVTERPNSWMATFCFTIASGIRSNGILNAGFIAHFSIHSIAQAYYADLGILKVMQRTIQAVCQIICIVSPFVAFQYYAFIRYCYEPEICEKTEAKDCFIDHVWCENKIPSIYNHIQGAWDNGFMAYWQYKKIPLFLLASPTYWFIFKALKKTVEDTSFRIIKTDFFGTRSARAGLPWAGVAMQICCWVHLIFLSLFCLFFMNVEVVTRLVWSSSPLVYIFGFQVLQRGQSCPVRLTVITYCLFYQLAGILLHSNHYPWT